MSIEKLAVPVRPVKSARHLPGEERVEAICQALDTPHKIKFLLELWQASIEATESSDFSPLIKLIADWEATVEILTDKELADSIKEERNPPEEERGRSWEQIRQELCIK